MERPPPTEAPPESSSPPPRLSEAPSLAPSPRTFHSLAPHALAPEGTLAVDPATVIADLEAELQASGDDPRRRAILQWEIARVHENDGKLGNAVRAHLAAFNLDPTYRAPLQALVRIMERIRSFKNLARLYREQARRAENPADRAAALLDLAAHQEDRENDPASARDTLDEAYAADPRTSALALERVGRREGDAGKTLEALSTRAAFTAQPELRALLLIELAEARVAVGDIDEAFLALDEALTTSTSRRRVLETMERLARQHGRSDVLARALEDRAELALDATRGTFAEDAPEAQASRDASVRAAERLREAAEHRAAGGEFEAASALLARARDLAPGRGDASATARRLAWARRDLATLRELAREASGPPEDAPRAPASTLEAAEQLTLARALRERGDASAARRLLDAVGAAHPASPALHGAEDAHYVRVESRLAFADRLEARAPHLEPVLRVEALWRAATLAFAEVAEPMTAPEARAEALTRALGLYEAAGATATEAGLDDDALAILREHQSAAQLAGAHEAVLASTQALLAEGATLDPAERAALLRARHVAETDAEARLTNLRDAAGDPDAAGWAPDALRVHAAAADDHLRLGEAHRHLSEVAPTAEAVAGHLAASARALLRAGEVERAKETLREALRELPGQPYALALLEEVLRRGGEAQEVVALLRDAAEVQSGPRAAVMRLLLAGAAAEAGGDVSLAARTYEDAADMDPEAISALSALRRLAEREGDEALTLRALEALAMREAAQPEGGGRMSLELGEHLTLVASAPALAEAPLGAALDEPEVAVDAALALALLPARRERTEARARGLERLIEATQGTADAPRLYRELGATAEGTGGERGDAARATLLGEGDEEGAPGLAPDDVWALWSRILRTGATRPEVRARAWTGLSRATQGDDGSLALAALRATLLGGGDDAEGDAFLSAQELAMEAPETVAAAVAVDETLGAGDDPEARAEALLSRRAFASPETESALAAAAGRALAAAGRPEALAALRSLVEDQPDDLASWDALRVAARRAGAWEDVAAACDRLAEVAAGEDRAELLEESAAVRMDQLGQDNEAAERLWKVVRQDRRRPNAYFRLHDLLASGASTETSSSWSGSARTPSRTKNSSLGSSTNAPGCTERSASSIRASAPSPSSACWTHATREASHWPARYTCPARPGRKPWTRSVTWPRADVPAEQARIARLGAAETLLVRMQRPDEALAELESLVASGVDDLVVRNRMVDVALRAERFDVAAAACDAASRLSEGKERVAWARRAGELRARELGDVGAALNAYRRALEERPTDLEAGEAVAGLLTDRDARRAHAEAFEASVRRGLDRSLEPDLLRKLLAAARWKGDRDLAFVASEMLIALGAANDEEHRARASVALRRPRSSALDEASLALLRHRGDAGPSEELARLAAPGLLAALRREPAALGASRAQLLSPRRGADLRDELAALVAAFGLEVGDLYHGGHDASAVVALPGKREKGTWVLGGGLNAPLDAYRRFLVGRQALGLRLGTGPLLDVSAVDGATWLVAAAQASDAPLTVGAELAGVPERARTLSKALPRRTRRVLAQVAPAVPEGGARLEAFCTAARRTANRAGLLLGGDITSALRHVLGETPSVEKVQRHADALDLARFWLSPACIALRRQLGVSA